MKLSDSTRMINLILRIIKFHYYLLWNTMRHAYSPVHSKIEKTILYPIQFIENKTYNYISC